MTPRLTILPDIEQVLSAWLRAQPELGKLVQDRVYTAFPRQKGGGPMILVRRFGGQPPLERPLVLDQALVQADCYGGDKAQAWQVAATLRALIGERCDGTGTTPTVYVRACRYLPDETYPSPRPRYVCDLEAFVRPWAAAPAAPVGPRPRPRAAPVAATRPRAAPVAERPRAAPAAREESLL